MKNKMATFGILSLALATAALIAWASFRDTASEALPAPKSTVVSQSPIADVTTSGHGIIPPNSVDKEWDGTLNGGASVSTNFKINQGSGHLKLSLRNNSSYPMSVTIEHLESGLVYDKITLKGKESKDWISYKEGYSQGMRTGYYIIQASGVDQDVNVKYWGKLASSATL